MNMRNNYAINSVSTVFDTVTAAAAEECSIMSCAKSQKRFSGDWLLSTHSSTILWAGYS